MTAPVITGVALALLASLALNTSYVVQHLGSAGAPEVSVLRPVAALAGLLRSKLWLAGAGLGLSGWALHIGALSQAPLSVVQAFAAGGLALTVPIGARLTRTTLAARERAAVGLMALALLGLGLGLGPVPRHGPPAPALAVFMLLSAGAAAVLALRAGRNRGPMLAIAAGILYGAADAATKAVTGVAHSGLWAIVLSPWTACVAAGSIGAFYAFQRGLQIGPMLPVIAVMTAATNIVAVGGGLVVFGESLGTSSWVIALHSAALGLVVLAAWWLAPAQARLAGEPERAGRGDSVAAAAPKTKASKCSAPARSAEGGMQTAKMPRPAIAASASRSEPRMRSATPAVSAPITPAHTQEIP